MLPEISTFNIMFIMINITCIGLIIYGLTTRLCKIGSDSTADKPNPFENVTVEDVDSISTEKDDGTKTVLMNGKIGFVEGSKQTSIQHYVYLRQHNGELSQYKANDDTAAALKRFIGQQITVELYANCCYWDHTCLTKTHVLEKAGTTS